MTTNAQTLTKAKVPNLKSVLTPPRRKPAGLRTRNASIAEAKAKLSELVHSVESRRAEVVLMRRGIAVARLVPMQISAVTSGFGWMRGSGEVLSDIDGPSGEEWDVVD